MRIINDGRSLAGLITLILLSLFSQTMALPALTKAEQ